MRAVADKALPDSCTIRRKTLASDGAGGSTETPADVATVACRLMPRTAQPQDKAIADKQANVSGWYITLPYATDVREKDIIVIGARSFEVEKAQAHSWEVSRRVFATEVV